MTAEDDIPHDAEIADVEFASLQHKVSRLHKDLNSAFLPLFESGGSAQQQTLDHQTKRLSKSLIHRSARSALLSGELADLIKNFVV